MSNTNFSTDQRRAILRAALRNTQGQFFAVKFTKKDGSERLMSVKSYVKGMNKGGKDTTAHKPEYIKLYEFGKHPKNVNLDTISEIRFQGHKIKVG